MTTTVRYQNTLQGNLIQIGNTLGLSKAQNALTPGTMGSIGAFITMNPTAAPGWPMNTTLDYHQNSSPANLQLPPGAVVKYAELIWSASYIINDQSGQIADVSANINDPINFTDPHNTVYSITIADIDHQNVYLQEPYTAPLESSLNYVKSRDVTTIVQNGGSGTYICGNVPCTMVAGANYLQYAGWSLYVVYELAGDRVRYIITYVANEKFDDLPFSVPINYVGPPFPIRTFYTVAEGDAEITGEVYLIRPDPPNVTYYYLGTPVQPSYPLLNPFSSQITTADGQVDTFGPFGTVNQSGLNVTNVSGGRQGWDTASNIDVLPAFTGGAVSNLGMDIGANDDPSILVGLAYVVDMSQPLASLTKSVSPASQISGNTVTYTLVYDFTQVPVLTTTIVLIDTVPYGATYKPGTVTVNGSPQPSYNPNPPGISLGNISAPTTFTVTYDVAANTVYTPTTVVNDAYGSYHFVSAGVDVFGNTSSNTATFQALPSTVPQVPTPNPIQNIASTLYDFVVDPILGTSVPGSVNSNPTYTKVNTAFLNNIYKTTDKSFADVGTILTYTVAMTNTGNTTANNVMFIDTIPNGTSIVSGSLTLNGSSIAGNPNPPGVNIGSVGIGSTATVAFKVQVYSIPSSNTITNSASTTFNFIVDPTLLTTGNGSSNSNSTFTKLNYANLSNITKTTDSLFIGTGSTVTYSVAIKNTGSTTANNVMFIDTIPNSTSLVSGSLTLNGSSIAGNPNPPGINIGSIPVGSTSTVSFKVYVYTLPLSNSISNSASTTFSYVVDPTLGTTGTGSSNSNLVTSQVSSADLSTMTKFVDKVFVTCGDIITYTISLPNSGNVTAINVYLHETIPTGTIYVANSLKVNSSPSSDSISNISVGTIPPGSTSSVTFSVKVTC